MIEGAGLQVRAGLGGAYALDFGAVLAFAEALGADVGFVAELLPSLEPLILARFVSASPEEPDEQ